MLPEFNTISAKMNEYTGRLNVTPSTERRRALGPLLTVLAPCGRDVVKKGALSAELFQMCLLGFNLWHHSIELKSTYVGPIKHQGK